MNDRKVSFGVKLITLLGDGTVRFGCYILIAGVIIAGVRVYPQDMLIPFRQVDARPLTAATDGVVVNVQSTPYNSKRITYSFVPKGGSAKVTGVSYKALPDYLAIVKDMEMQINYDPANPARSKMIGGESKSASIAYMLWLLVPALGLFVIYRQIMTAGKRRYELLTNGCIVRGKLARATQAYLLQSVLWDGTDEEEESDPTGKDTRTSEASLQEYVDISNYYAFECVTPEGRTLSVPTSRKDPAWHEYLGDNDGKLVISNLIKQVMELDSEEVSKSFSPEFEKVDTGNTTLYLTDEYPCLDDGTLIRIAQRLRISIPDKRTGPIHASGVLPTASGTTFEDYIIYDPVNPDDAAILRDRFPTVQVNEAGELVCGTGAWIKALKWPALALCVTAAVIYLRVRQGESIWTKIISLMPGIS